MYVILSNIHNNTYFQFRVVRRLNREELNPVFSDIRNNSLIYLAFSYFDFYRTWWWLLQKRVVSTEIDSNIVWGWVFWRGGFLEIYINSNDLVISVGILFSLLYNTSIYYQEPPFVQRRLSDGKPEGFCVDILHEVSSMMNFEYNIRIMEKQVTSWDDVVQKIVEGVR